MPISGNQVVLPVTHFDGTLAVAVGSSEFIPEGRRLTWIRVNGATPGNVKPEVSYDGGTSWRDMYDELGNPLIGVTNVYLHWDLPMSDGVSLRITNGAGFDGNMSYIYEEYP